MRTFVAVPRGDEYLLSNMFEKQEPLNLVELKKKTLNEDY